MLSRLRSIELALDASIFRPAKYRITWKRQRKRGTATADQVQVLHALWQIGRKMRESLVDLAVWTRDQLEKLAR